MKIELTKQNKTKNELKKKKNSPAPFLHFLEMTLVCSHKAGLPFSRRSLRDFNPVSMSHSDHGPFANLQAEIFTKHINESSTKHVNENLC
jgi:hypothetical protein